MKKTILFFNLIFSSFISFGQVQNVDFTIDPPSFNEDENITIKVSGLDRPSWGLTADNVNDPDSGVYLWMWRIDGSGQQDSPTNGQWTNSDEAQRMTYNQGLDEYTFQLTPDSFFGTTGITEIGMLVKADDGSDTGSGERKSQDELFSVGRVRVELKDPAGDAAVVASGSNYTINAEIFEGGSVTVQGSIEVFLNDVSQGTGSCSFPNCPFVLNNVTSGGEVRVVGTPPSSTETGEATFDLIVAPANIEEAIPSGLVDGINYDDADDTKASLVIDAPGKDYVMVAGSFNNYDGGSGFMKKDPGSDKFWLEVTGLTSGQIETYQYWVYDESPVTDSPTLVKTADPFSTLVLSPFDDPWIPSASYPNLPSYPSGQQREVTVLQTGKSAYNWQITNFVKPKKEDLVIYEVLIRDFDENRNFQDLIDNIDYFKNLNINAIELMPVMEFEGNEGWGYNTVFHMALDKFYGTENKLKELIDVCHQNGIAVILDLALNHAYGRNPMVRMWMDDPDKNGWGGPSSENPYFNEEARHAYSVGSDFDHSNPLTKDYTKRVIKHWIEEFKIDGFRWDLTKGFTQLCSSGDEGCTNGTPADRVDILKDYVDYSWSLDETHYAIFEHLGDDSEEQQWANYRLGDAVPKGVMMWSEMWNDYKELALGYASNFDRMGHTAHGFTEKRTLGYPESHDKDRIMYEMKEYGDNNNGFDLNTALTRMSALGAVTIPIPGPKMIWHFAELGMDNSIWLCSDGVTVDSGNDGCKLATKPQPQWTENWLGDPNRSQIYSDWARLIELKINEDVFESDYAINSGTLTPRIYVYDDAIPVSQLKNVVILANFSTSTQNVTPDFPYNGTWYDLMDGTGSTSITVNNTADPISIPAGGFKIYGNQSSIALDTDDVLEQGNFVIFPNPAKNNFTINKNVESLNIYDITGKVVSKFNGNFTKGESFDISELNQGLYIIEIENRFGQQSTSKLIKQ